MNIQRMILEIQSEQASLTEKNIALMTEKEELKQKIASIKGVVAYAHSKGSMRELSGEAKRVLVSVTEHRSLSVEEAAEVLSMNIATAEFWLDFLCDVGFLAATPVHTFEELKYMAGYSYSIGPKGREYLVSKGLV